MTGVQFFYRKMIVLQSMDRSKSLHKLFFHSAHFLNIKAGDRKLTLYFKVLRIIHQ